MKIFIFLFGIIVAVSANCGCLKCSKHLHVVSRPNLPYKVIYRGAPCGGLAKPLPYEVQVPVIPPPLPCIKKDYDIAIQQIPLIRSYNPEHIPVAHPIKVEAPVIVPTSLCPVNLLSGLIAAPDRVVLPAPECKPLPRPVPIPMPPPPPPPAVYIPQCVNPGPIIERLDCSCRYGRAKRDIPMKNSISFLLDFLPPFLKTPLQKTLKVNKPKIPFKKPILPYYHNHLKKEPFVLKTRNKKNYDQTFLQKLQKLNQRNKRSLVFNDGELVLPFFKVNDIEGLDELDKSNLPKFIRISEIENSEEEEEEAESTEEQSNEQNPKEYLKPLHFNHMLPHNPLFYFLNTPIRFLHHFHKLGEHIKPVFRSFPHVMLSSKKYLRDFGRHLKNDFLDITSNLIGEFDDIGQKHYWRPRFRRSLNNTYPFEPEYSIAFNPQNRTKRYILKVVDEDEVQEFLQEKLGGMGVETYKPKNDIPKISKQPKRKLVIEKLTPKIILDKDGRPFVEINGVKRPLLFKKSQKTKEKPKKNESDEDKSTECPPESKEEIKEKNEKKTEDIASKIDDLINQAQEKINKNGDNNNKKKFYEQEVPIQMIREKINEIIDEIQHLITLDLEQYSKIHSNLNKLQNFKNQLVKEWKNFLMNGKCNDLSTKIKILDEFKIMQQLKDETVKNIAKVLQDGSTFMMKKLIKLLVRLQKLQCIIYMVVEDFSERLKTDTNFDLSKQIKFVDSLDKLQFVVQMSVHEMENDLKKERDHALDNEMKLLENLRKICEDPDSDPSKTYAEAKLLWEIKNIESIQKEIIKDMNKKISEGLKVRNELKILFDMLRQLENCEQRQTKLLDEWLYQNHKDVEEPAKRKKLQNYDYPQEIYENSRNYRDHVIIDDKKPIHLVSNGYRLKAYKMNAF